uniref:Uncharacterized protein n=1 Tax=Pseudonaja textilis TaxID=8673 RepID=A0A670ZCW2_PSETE
IPALEAGPRPSPLQAPRRIPFLPHSLIPLPANHNSMFLLASGCSLRKDRGRIFFSLFSSPKPKYLTSLRGHVSAVYQIAWSADSRLLVSGSSDSTLKVWDAKTQKLAVDLPGHADEVWLVPSRIALGCLQRPSSGWKKDEICGHLEPSGWLGDSGNGSPPLLRDAGWGILGVEVYLS